MREILFKAKRIDKGEGYQDSSITPIMDCIREAEFAERCLTCQR